jgi:hypothetical protein
VELAVLGMSGALYDSIFVVYISSTGAEILWRIDPAAFVVLLRWGRTSASARVRLCLTRRVVNALAMDILVGWRACSEERSAQNRLRHFLGTTLKTGGELLAAFQCSTAVNDSGLPTSKAVGCGGDVVCKRKRHQKIKALEAVS